jgi:hypothetical protein
VRHQDPERRIQRVPLADAAQVEPDARRVEPDRAADGIEPDVTPSPRTDRRRR